MDLQKQFSDEIAAFLVANDLKPAAFGRAALGDPNFVLELEHGRAPNLRTIERVRDYMKRYSSEAAA